MIYTGYYAKLKKYEEAGLYPVAISGKVPDFYMGVKYPVFAPRYDMFQRWKNGTITNEDYMKEYKEYLDTLERGTIQADLDPYNAEGSSLIFLCYEKSGDFCHRHILAEWLKDNFNYEVKEYEV